MILDCSNIQVPSSADIRLAQWLARNDPRESVFGNWTSWF